ncbi:MAG TPA: SPOR domain-containing protein [Gemmatimonadota bacterium]|nr:SPOR domain-containing protein [Gemmatimonadota bacterium]
MALLALSLFVAAVCMPARYREEAPPPETARDPASGQPAAGEGAGSEGATVVGHVSPDGALVADTLEESQPDTARVERETVVTGEIRPATELETVQPATVGAEAGVLATGWRVQAFASRAEAEASAAATRVQDALGDQTPVYVERDDPWFKVRVGDFSDRAAADLLRERMAGLGWPDAWAVRTTIRTTP